MVKLLTSLILVFHETGALDVGKGIYNLISFCKGKIRVLSGDYTVELKLVHVG